MTDILRKLLTQVTRLRLHRLLTQTRNQGGEFKWGGYHFFYADPLVFYEEFRSVFLAEIYKFEACSEKPLIIDAGGYIGTQTIYFKKLYPTAKILVFEPDKLAWQYLKRNVVGNRLSGVKLYPYCLGKTKGQKIFYPDKVDGGSLFGKKRERVTVPVVRLSTFITQPVDLLKMNIEGAENEVLSEIEPKLSYVREIIMEYHAFSNLPQTLDNILAVLARNGYRYVVAEIPFWPIHPPVKYSSGSRHFNLIYARRV